MNQENMYDHMIADGQMVNQENMYDHMIDDGQMVQRVPFSHVAMLHTMLY